MKHITRGLCLLGLTGASSILKDYLCFGSITILSLSALLYLKKLATCQGKGLPMKYKMLFHIKTAWIAIIDAIFAVGTAVVAGALTGKAHAS